MIDTVSHILNQEESKTEQKSVLDAGTIVIGVITDIDEKGSPLVTYDLNPTGLPCSAITTVSVTRKHISRQVALLFNQGNLEKPVIMGIIHNPLDEILENFEFIPENEKEQDIDPFHEVKSPANLVKSESILNEEDSVYVDGKKVSIEGSEEVTFKCGKASITLLNSGKILIRGTYLLNRSSGVNRIMGGSVQVN